MVCIIFKRLILKYAILKFYTSQVIPFLWTFKSWFKWINCKRQLQKCEQWLNFTCDYVALILCHVMSTINENNLKIFLKGSLFTDIWCLESVSNLEGEGIQMKQHACHDWRWVMAYGVSLFIILLLCMFNTFSN